MKIKFPRNESGMVTVIAIALLAIMMILILTESSAVIRLHREMKWTEQQQIKGLNATPTNIVTQVSETK